MFHIKQCLMTENSAPGKRWNIKRGIPLGQDLDSSFGSPSSWARGSMPELPHKLLNVY